MKIEKYEVNKNDMSRDLRLKDIFDIVNYQNETTISITKKKTMKVFFNNEDIGDREVYNLKLKTEWRDKQSLKLMYYILKNILSNNVVIDIFNRNVFNRSSIGYEYINRKDLDNIYIGNYNNDLGYIINEML